MKPFLIQYDTNTAGVKNLLMLVYADNFEEAVDKLKDYVEFDNKFGSRRIIEFNNLTIE